MTVDAKSVLAAALTYAARGWRVVPIKPGEKSPSLLEWQNAATTDTDLIRDWWTRWPAHGIGIVTGVQSGIFVLDVDVADGKRGDETLADLEHQHGKLGDTVETITGSGGRHLYYRMPRGSLLDDPPVIHNDAGKRLGPGLDVRGEGGQVLAPPTLHPNGRRYEWEALSDPEAVEVADAPPWLVELLTVIPDQAKARRCSAPAPAGVERPGDRWARTVEWADLLVADGATYLGTRIEHKTKTPYEAWARPGVDHLSATLYYKGSDVLKVFTSEWRVASPVTGEITVLEQEATYTKFGYYAATRHGGDQTAAARQLAEQMRVDDKDLFKQLIDTSHQTEAKTAVPVPVASPQVNGNAASQVSEPPSSPTDKPISLLGDSEPAPISPAPTAPATPPEVEPPPPVLLIENVATIATRVDAAPSPGFLARPVWPADAYGIIGAENKAGKTWAICDLAVTVAAGLNWLDTYPCDVPGPVLVFVGEGGERKTIRRLRAVCGHYGVTLEDLPIRLCHRVPRFQRVEHVLAVIAELAAHPARLVIVDPLYLAAAGAKSSSVFEMAEVLEPIQHAAQSAGAALVVVHHWNKTGQGTDRNRFSGAGSAEWGRVLASVAVESRKITAEGASDVTLSWEFIGDEIADAKIRTRRLVWTDDDADLASPMHYVISKAHSGRDESSPWDGPTNCMDAIVELLRETGAEWSKPKLERELRDRGRSFRNETIRSAAEMLADRGVLTTRLGSRNSRLFRLATDVQQEIGDVDNGLGDVDNEPF